MIQTNELRIGNYVSNIHGETLKVSIVTENAIHSKEKYDIIGCPSSWINPIHLTEEWLINFGFEKLPNNRFEHDLLDWEVERQGNKFSFCIWDAENPAVTNFIMHSYFLHTFQNNFFALTGIELTHQKIN